MATSVYFNNYNSKPEQRLYEDLINETVQIWGIDAFYMPRTSESSVDLIFGDDPTKKFDEAYPVEIYVKSVDNFEGQELFSKFGLEIQHQIKFLITSKAFNRHVAKEYSRPREGDLLWLTNFQALFEIKFVNQQHFYYAFGQKNFYGFELVCERFRYSNEKVDTGINEIDSAAEAQTIVYDFSMHSGGSNTYVAREIVYQGTSYANSTASAVVVSWDKPTLVLRLKDVKGIFTKNTAIVGNTSYSSYTMNTVNLLDNTNDGLDNNSEIKDLANDFLDFSENNPFGEP